MFQCCSTALGGPWPCSCAARFQFTWHVPPTQEYMWVAAVSPLDKLLTNQPLAMLFRVQYHWLHLATKLGTSIASPSINKCDISVLNSIRSAPLLQHKLPCRPYPPLRSVPLSPPQIIITSRYTTMKKSKSYMHAKLFLPGLKMTQWALYTISLDPSSSSLTFLLSSMCLHVNVCVCVWERGGGGRKGTERLQWRRFRFTSTRQI